MGGTGGEGDTGGEGILGGGGGGGGGGEGILGERRGAVGMGIWEEKWRHLQGLSNLLDLALASSATIRKCHIHLITWVWDHWGMQGCR